MENPPNALVCAVDLGGTNLRAANIDSGGKIQDRARILTPDPDDADHRKEGWPTSARKKNLPAARIEGHGQDMDHAGRRKPEAGLAQERDDGLRIVAQEQPDRKRQASKS